jgi:hypothetical protein
MQPKIEPLRRTVRDNDVRATLDLAPDHELLPVAPRQRTDEQRGIRRPDVETAHNATAVLRLDTEPPHAETGERALAETQKAGGGPSRKIVWRAVITIFGDVGETSPSRFGGRAGNIDAVDKHAPFGLRPQAGDRFCERGLHRPGDANNFAPPDGERNVAKRAANPEPLDREPNSG